MRHYVAAPTEAPTKGEMTGTTTTEAPVLARSENIRMLAFLAPRGTAGELFILQHPWIGYSAASLLIVLGILGFFVADILGTFKTELNVDQMVRERKHMWRKQEEVRLGYSSVVWEYGGTCRPKSPYLFTFLENTQHHPISKRSRCR